MSRLWQIHVFGEGNTRTTAVFFIKYLRTLGFSATNDIFAENSWYFRNALVRANYNDLQKGIHETTEYVELFFRNLLLNEKYELHNRDLHIGGLFQSKKVDIETIFGDRIKNFSTKTVVHIVMLYDKFGEDGIWGRSSVVELLGLKNASASKLISKLLEAEIIIPVTGFGKGKYRFICEGF